MLCNSNRDHHIIILSLLNFAIFLSVSCARHVLSTLNHGPSVNYCGMTDGVYSCCGYGSIMANWSADCWQLLRHISVLRPTLLRVQWDHQWATATSQWVSNELPTVTSCFLDLFTVSITVRQNSTFEEDRFSQVLSELVCHYLNASIPSLCWHLELIATANESSTDYNRCVCVVRWFVPNYYWTTVLMFTVH